VPEHRLGVAYRDIATRSRLTNVDPAAAQGRLNFRGRESTPTPSASGPQRSRQVPNDLTRRSPAAVQQRPALAVPRAATPGNVPGPVAGFASRPLPGPSRTDQGFNRVPTPVAQPVYRQPVALPPTASPVFRQPVVAPPVFNPAPRYQVEMESNRGSASLGAPASRAAPAAPMQRGR
jgi:hypothetical protein